MARPSQGMAGGQDAAGGVLDGLERQVQAHEANGAVRATLGSCPMPDGYALMQDLADGTFFWLRADGAESLRHYSRWEIWRLAKADSEKTGRLIRDVIRDIQMNIKTETVYRRAAMLSELDEQYRLDFVKCLQPGDVVGVYDVFFGNIYYPDFSGNDVVKKTTPSGIIKLENSEFTFDRFGCGRGKAKIGIGRRGKMIGLPK